MCYFAQERTSPKIFAICFTFFAVTMRKYTSHSTSHCKMLCMVGILRPSCPLLNYLLLIAKLYTWDCRRNQILPNINGFKFKVRLKHEVELYIGRYGERKDILRNEWAGFRIFCYKSNSIVLFCFSFFL